MWNCKLLVNGNECLKQLSGEDYKKITKLLQDKGIDVSKITRINTAMNVIYFREIIRTEIGLCSVIVKNPCDGTWRLDFILD